MRGRGLAGLARDVERALLDDGPIGLQQLHGEADGASALHIVCSLQSVKRSLLLDVNVASRNSYINCIRRML